MISPSDVDFSPLPAPVATLFTDVLIAFESAGIGWTLSGSACTGEFDRWSDLDLKVSISTGEATEVVRAAVTSAGGQVLSQYSGVAVHRPQLEVMYVLTHAHIAKIDVDGVAAMLPRGDADWPLVWAPPWIYQISIRIARGEYLAAARAIDQYREDALIPLMERRLHRGLTGHRRLEERLSEADLARIIGTYATRPSRVELTAAWSNLCDLVREELTRGGYAATRALFERFVLAASSQLS
ncbi:hypothetical protein [Microbacterium oxydans]|uniref:Polymerase nucleotidyl transferase domain-containing protein n=1 Tax=Microbacterium oxydans TaxID=82380 RepID=A0A3S9WG59_9MICO|nr:hypothetical protein CVS54_00379 [Microbacterium oxydans]